MPGKTLATRGAALVCTLLACASSGQGAPPRPAVPAAPALENIRTDAFDVTCGGLVAQADGRALVQSPKMRAVVDRPTGEVVDLHFTYMGPTQQLMALSSGLSRIQVGLKLFARDACNLVYVMWRLHPTPSVVVSTKRNAGLQQSSSCGNRGYANMRPKTQAEPPPVGPGVPHRLRVHRKGPGLTVYADDILAWQGTLDSPPDELTGGTGIRSDNGRFIVRLQLSLSSTSPATRSSGSEEE